MMKTRRKSKAAAAAAAVAEADPTTSTRENSPLQRDATLSLTLPEDIDINVLSALLPDVSLTAPSPDAILALYKLVIVQVAETEAAQRETEEVRAEIERKDVELDQALQDKESVTSELENTLESVKQELTQVKQENADLASARNELQHQITSLSSNQSASSTEVETLRRKVEDTEREKRELIGVVSRLKEDITQRDEEIQNLRANLKQARQDQQALESQLREVRSTETSTKFKLETYAQQLQLAKDEAERTSAELTAKTEEFAKYRRAKHSELAQLQASHDALQQSHATTENTLKALQSAHTAQSHQLTQALARVQDLTGRLAEQEATYSSEAAGLKRLVAMMEEREAQAKAIVESIEKEWAGVGDKAERREAVLREEIEASKQRAEAAEKRVEELQKVLDRMDRGEFPVPFGTPGTPNRTMGTPVREGTPDFLMQGMMGLSPTVAMASRSQKSGKTFTEVYADYVKLQEEFAQKSAEYEHMDRTLASVLAQIEERAPILAEQRAEYDRLQTESAQLATQLAQTLAERDALAATAEDNAQKFTKCTRENELLQKQLNDLGRQIRVLLKELGRQQDPSIPSDETLELDEDTQPAENIEAVITNNLVLFRSIPALQEQNQKLLRVVRELGAKMEAEEKDYRDALDKEQSEAVREAHEAIKQLQEQLESHKRSSEVTIQAYMKERDSLRSLLSRERASASTRAVNGVNGNETDGASQADIATELAEVQSQFEAYRTEMGVDSVRLREEAVAAQREANQLGASLAKAHAKIEFLNERHRMVQDQNAVQSRQLEDATQRNQQLYDQYTRVDIECRRLSEDLLASNSLVEQMRNECANLRAEKKIWESVQSRLVEENKTLAVERSRLSDLMANVQRMHNDLERSGENDRHRLENQIQMLETQTQELRTQLNQERESLRHLTLQKEIELREHHTRIEKSAQELAQTRESLVGAETSKKHLEEQVDQLSRQLQGNEEKLAVYERRASGVNGIVHRPDEDLSREQQLEAEVAELRSALKVAQVDLAAARSHVQQFQEISQANESALAALSATHDEYKMSTEAELARRQSEYAALAEKLSTAEQELARHSEKLAETQRLLESERIAWANDKRTLEETIIDMSTSERNSESDRASRESDVREQEERAKAAEERYSREVVAHAESIKAIEELKAQLAKVQSSARDYQASAETAQVKLSTSEASWKEQKEALEKEIADLNTRCKDLSEQNSLLHQHLESVSSQAARIRQAADNQSNVPSGEGDTTDDADTKLSELRSVVAYLRKEKEIVDLQLELSKQENTRLKTQIDHLSHSLEETRKTLSEEREHAVNSAASEAQHVELVDKINQLTILRESNATLRADCEAHARRSRELDTKLKQLSAELDPAKEQLRIAQAELEAKDQQLKRLEDESRKWKERNAQLLSKYDRIDPAEVQSLKEEIDALKVQKTELEKAIQERDVQATVQAERISKLEDKASELRETGRINNDRFRAQFAQFRAEKTEMTATIESLEKQLATAIAERDNIKSGTDNTASSTSSEVTQLTHQLQALRAEKAALERTLAEKTARAAASGQSSESQLAEKDAMIAALREERDRLLAEKTNSTAAAGTPLEAQKAWESEKVLLIQAREDALKEAKAAAEQAARVANEMRSVKFSNEKIQVRIQEITRARAAETERAAAEQQAAVTAAVEKLRNELQSAAPSALPQDVIDRHAQELRALEESLTRKHQEELRLAVEKAAAAAQQQGASPNQDAAIAAAIAAHDAKLKEQHELDIASAVERGRMEQAAKGKLKDAQLVRAQTKLKELEAQILEWQKQGIIPPATNASTSTPANPTAGPSTTPAAPTAAPPAPAPATSAQSSLPRKPTTDAPASGVGRGRGAARGGTRGTRGLAIRGAAPGRGAPAAAAEAAGVSIMGAASKRSRDDEAPADDSLAKRLRPSEGGTGKPVVLRRDRVLPP